MDFARIHKVSTLFADVLDGVSTGSIDGFEIENLVFAVGVPDDVAKDGVDSHGCIGNHHNGFEVCVQEFSNSCSGGIQELGTGVSNEYIGR